MTLSEVFSLIFFITFIVYFFFGTFILHFNVKSQLYRLFFLCCLALCIWAFSFCIANSAPDYETCLFWRRVAVFGWGTFFSLLLHFIMILTGQKKLLHNKLTYVLLYLPVAVNILAFSLYSDMAVNQYNLVLSAVGWVNVSHSSVWDWFYNFQYIGFSLASLLLLLRWGMKSDYQDKKRQSVILSTSYAAAILLGTLTEFFINMVSGVKVPQLAPVIILIPITAMLFCIKRYGLLALPIRSENTDVGMILNEGTRSRLYFYLTRAYIIGAFINFCALFFSGRESLPSILIFSGVLLALGFLLQIIQNLRIGIEQKELLSDIVMAATIPIISLRYAEYSAVYAWITPVIYIFVSIVINKSRTLYLFSAVSVATLLVIWIMIPESSFTFSSVDHAVRLCLFVIIMWIARFIHDIYLQRLAENEEQIKLQMLVSHITSVFITVNENNMDEKINIMLSMCVNQFKFDNACLLILVDNQKSVSKYYQWSRPEEENVGLINSDVGKLEWQEVKYFLDYGSLYVPDSDALPDDDPNKKWLKGRQIKTAAYYPLMINNKVQGILGFKTAEKAVLLRKDQQDVLIVLTNLVSDILFRVKIEKEINHKAFYDSLTGLANRELFMSRLQQAINIARRNGKLVAVAFMDIDSFKTINDTMGHEGGDSLLVHMAHRLSSSFKKHDMISRFGGDEFLIMISQASQLKEILAEADKLMEAVKKPIQIKNQEFFVTASMGIAVFPVDGENPDDLIKNADLAMYASKQKGKNKYTLCSSDMKKDLHSNMELTNDLYHAMERNELLLHYQPQIDAKTGEIIGIEVLLRWLHPRKGMILPGDFIILAEKTGLINSIGQWVLTNACRQNKIWQDMDLIRVKMAVNLSLAQFMNPYLIQTVKDILHDTGLDPSFLELEVTESIAGNEIEYTIKKLEELKELGVSITMDDFGTEYSSLSRIKVLPVDRIKIDGQFIHGIGRSGKDEGIIKVIIQLGKSLELDVLAEKVETEEQLLFLKENHCNHIQGFYYYKPVAAEELENILRNRKL